MYELCVACPHTLGQWVKKLPAYCYAGLETANYLPYYVVGRGVIKNHLYINTTLFMGFVYKTWIKYSLHFLIIRMRAVSLSV